MLRQIGANFGAAFSHINPVQGAFSESATPKKGEEPIEPGGAIVKGLKSAGGDLLGAAGFRAATPLTTDTGELHQAQDARFQSSLDRKKIVDTLVSHSFDANGKLKPIDQVKAAFQAPELQAAMRANPLEAALLKNEIQTAIKDKLEGQKPADVAPKFTVAEAERARFYLNQVSKIPPAQANQYLQDQAKKGYLTNQVFKQMNYLRSRQSPATR